MWFFLVVCWGCGVRVRWLKVVVICKSYIYFEGVLLYLVVEGYFFFLYLCDDFGDMLMKEKYI